jgi:hypothetical protein
MMSSPEAKMTIENEQELRYSITALAKQYSLVEHIAAQTIGDPETRADVIDGVESMARKIEREVAVYLAEKYGFLERPERTAAAEPLKKAA